MEFQPTDRGRGFSVHRGASVILGRQPVFELTHSKISRQHAEISCAAAGATASGLPTVTVKALKRLYVQRCAPQGAVEVLQPGQSAQLSPGDVLYLVRDGNNTLEAGFSLQLPQQQPAAATAAGAAARPHKRSRTAAGSGEPSSAALGSGRPSQLNKQQEQQQLPGGSNAQASVQGPVSGGGQQQQQQQQLFSGVRLVVWDTHHTHQAVARAQQAGLVLQSWIDADTTHVLAGYDLTTEQVQQALQAEQQRRRQLRQQQQEQQEQEQQEQPVVQSSLPPASTPTAAPPQQQQATSPVTRQLWFSPKNELGAAAAAAAGAVGGGIEVELNALPSCINFVTLSWLTDSLAAKHRLPERPYLIQLHAFQGSPVPLSPESKRSRRKQSGNATLAHGASGAAAAAAAAAGGSQQPELPSPATPRPQQHDAAVAAPFGYDAAAAAAAAAAAGPGTPQQQPQQQTLQGIAKQQQQQQPSRQQYLAPLPSEVCAPGAVWGEDDRWIEPWDDAAAADTVAQLLANWHRQPWKRNTSAAAAAGADDADPGRQLQADAWLDDSEDQLAAEPGDNGVCEHPACSRQGFCFVAEMQAVKANYSTGRQDQFRVKAALQAIRALERLTQPLITAQDIDAMLVGPKSREKLKEILGLGYLRRNQEVASSERHQVMELFMSVWGAAESSANKWWQAGCRTLQDVVERVGNLTSTQRVGLKYYDAFKRRIPRAEVEECIRIVRKETLETLQDLTSMPLEQLTHLLHVRGMGSYGRGKQDCGDMDILIVPGPDASGRVTTEPVLAGLLQRLAHEGYVTQDLPVEAGDGKQSWMGVWRGPSSPCHRRIDIKVYPQEALPFAINYFVSGQDFCRALRYWCNRPLPSTAARAAAMHPAANSFHLSDTRLLLTSRLVKGRRGRPGSAAAAGAPAAADGELEQQQQQQQGPLEPEQQAAATAAAAAAPATIGDVDGGCGNPASVRVLRTARELIESSVSGPAIVVGEVVCTCETDIFQAVGLAYVPPHMRHFEV